MPLLPSDFFSKNDVARRFLQPRNLLVYAHDVVMAFVAFLAAFVLRLGTDSLHRPDVMQQAALFAAVAAVTYLFTGIYRHVWEYVSAKDASNILRTATIVVLVFLPAWFFVARLENLPRSMPLISWFALMMLLAGPRLLYRMMRDRRMHNTAVGAPGSTPILLIGAGPEAENFIRARAGSYHILGMLTAREDRIGQVIHGVEVLGRNQDLPRVVADLDGKERRPQKLILVGSDVPGETVQMLLALAERAGVPLERVTVQNDNVQRPKPIAIEDLLGRPQSGLDRQAMAAMITGRRVLVTGAGGSIGSELVRQISAAAPAHVSLVDNSEFNLYSIDMEVRQRYVALSCATILADVRDGALMRDLVARERPDIVFHAAALKHVPMVELNPLEGLLTNAVGTRNVADACVAAGVRVMVLISTDKAVNPSNVMGASKRVAEIYCQAADLRGIGTRFITVRFGNVLGSAGSVVPLFRKQLDAGGPLTVTHPDIERFFMTIHEAVELVLQAAALGPGRNDEGAIYVLDMGKPVKIIDLARDMIRLAGKTAEIGIQITGLRPGEKLKEELFHGQEPAVATDMVGVLLARPRTVDHAIIAAKLAGLEDVCRRRDESAALALVTDLVPELRRTDAPPPGKPHLKVIK